MTKMQYSNDHAKQSCIDIDFINPYRFLCMSLGITSWSLLANNLVMSLIEVLSREIGLKSEILTALSCFGTKVICDPFRLWRQTEPLWKAEQRL